TVGKFLEGKTPKQVEKITILDPACGSGSFLIGAYQYLLDWHKNWYVENNPEKWAGGKSPKLYQTEGGDWFLTTGERKKILLNNIYGVDIDNQAVEVTKLSLLLKVLEGESDQRLATQLKMFQERALPNLGNNIKCGNSIVGTDFYDTFDMSSLEPEEHYKINPFDWQNEFPEIFKKENPGFDAVIGNPPYVRQETLGTVFKEYAQKHFSSYTGMADLYVYFFEQSHKILCNGGFFGMICSNKFMRSNYGKGLREFLLKKTAIRQIIDFGELPVFLNASTFPAIFLTQNLSVTEQDFIYAPIKRLSFISLFEEVKELGIELDNKSIEGDNWTMARKSEVGIFEKMKQIGTPFGKYVKGEIYRGIVTGCNEAFIINRETKEKITSEDPKSAEIIKPFINGDDVRKYKINLQDSYVIFTRRGVDIKEYPSIENYLKNFKDRLMPKPKDYKGTDWKGRKSGKYKWYELQDTTDYYLELSKSKIIWPEIAKESRFTIDREGLFLNKTCFFSPVEDLYLLGLLNSKLIWFFLKNLCSVLGDANKKGRLLQQKIYIEQIPIRSIDFSNSSDKTRHIQIVELVNRMLLSNQQLKTTRTPQEKTMIQRQIETMDRKINQLVYELYDLTDDEIKIIEETT
ncbi:MAG: DNA methyltransferase, partial [Candidatus Eremiobacterota bacterium]